MQLARYFTTEKRKDQTVYDMFEWKKVDVIIKDHKSDSILFEGHDLEFPKQYSQNACDIIAKMYFRKTGVPGTNHETSMRQVAHRMVSFWTMALIDEEILREDQKEIFYDELVYMLLNQMWAPNSPQWFNTGLYHAYGIKGEESQEYYWDPKQNQVVESEDGYTRSQASACFIVGIEDSLLGEQSLMDNLTTASRLFKYGSGVGSNWSKIRGAGEHLSGGGVSSGLLSFQKVYDRNAGAIKSGGVTRRAAVMQVLDLDHPEILDFVRWKSREEDKVVALVKMGYEATLTGDAYETVSGQNVNNSVSIPDTYMRLVESKNPNIHWRLKGRKDHNVDTSINPQRLWEEICWAAWRCGDPGVQFTDTINKWNTCPNSGRIRGSNPCSEFLFLDDTSCNLASINVLKFYDVKKDRFNFAGYVHAIKLIQLALEGTIHWGQFPTPQIAENTYKFRPTGLGLTNIGALLMYLGIPYDSVRARSISAVLCSIMTAISYNTSALMAKEVGAFSEFDKNKEEMKDVVNAHYTAFTHLMHPGFDTKDHKWSTTISSLSQVSKLFTQKDIEVVHKLWEDTIKVGEKYGYRNAQVTVLAPTGTIAFAMDCDTTSSEPFFSHKVYKKVVDGSYMEIVNGVIPTALQRLDYTEDEIKDIMKYIEEGDGKIEGAPHITEMDLAVFDTASRCGSGTRFLSPMAHVKMVAALTPHLSGGISKTVNLPAESTVEDIKNVYMEAWRLGCKCIALYRDTCKVVQPLTTKMEEVKDENDIDNMNYWELLRYTKTKIEQQKEVVEMLQKQIKDKDAQIDALLGKTIDANKALDDIKDQAKLKREKLPWEPKCIKNAVKMDGYTFHIQRCFYDDGRLGEIFVSAGKQGDTVKGLMEVLCILISKVLQYGIPVEVISEILRGTEFSPRGMVRQHPYIKSATSVTDLLSKFLDMSIGDYTYCQVKPDPEDLKQFIPPLEVDEVQEVLKEHDPYVEGVKNVIDHLVEKHAENTLNAYLNSIGLKMEEIKSKDGGRGLEIINKLKNAEPVFGHTCTVCNSKNLVRAGTCLYCKDCGSSSGCS